jgi:hypothetical protein
MYDYDKGMALINTIRLEQEIDRIKEAEDLQLKEQLLEAKLEALKDRVPKMSQDDLDDLRLRVMALEVQIERLEKNNEDAHVLPVRRRYLEAKLRQLMGKK